MAIRNSPLFIQIRYLKNGLLKRNAAAILSQKYSDFKNTNGADKDADNSPIRVETVENPHYEKKLPPEPPTTCCRSNCANCVWVEYAQDMLEFYKDGGESALKIIDRIEDENLKAFLKMEIQMAMKK